MADLLQAENISKHFAGVAALKGASFALRPGEVHALMGENGAGKSTLAKILAGSIRADGGAIFLDGARVSIGGPLDAQRCGIGIIHQELDLFPHLTVGENIATANLQFHEGRLVRPKAIEAFCGPFLEQAGLRCDTRLPLSSLSMGQMQLVAIARALSMNARLILMDEPTSALFEDSVDRLFERIAEMKRRGVSVVYVSHKMDEIFRICDRVTVMRDGETIGTRELRKGRPEEIIRMMVGRELDFSARGAARQPGETLLSVTDLSAARLKRVSFELRRNEVLGIAGLVGAGRSELGAALAGLDRRTGGVIRLHGRPADPRSARDGLRAGIALLPEDRKLQGLMMQMSVVENTTLPALGRFSRFGVLQNGEERRSAEPWFRRLALKASSPDACVGSLSGGNQQKVLLARCLLTGADVVFLDDPARGVDVGAKQDIYRAIDELARAGKGVILVSSELPELLRCCDRIMVLREGSVTGMFDAREVTQEAIMTAATAAGGKS